MSNEGVVVDDASLQTVEQLQSEGKTAMLVAADGQIAV
jgi:hypothetical protein